MAASNITVKMRIRGLWRARLALRLCGLVLRVAPRWLRAPLCRAALWLSWFSIDMRMRGRWYRTHARLIAAADKGAQ